MAKTLNEIVYSILEVVSSFEFGDDFPVTETFVEDAVITVNQTLIRKAMTERRITQDLFMMHKGAIINELVSTVKYNGLTLQANTPLCNATIPSLISGLRGREIDFVASEGLGITFTRKPLRSLLTASTGYYSNVLHDYALSGNKIYFRRDDTDGVKFIVVNGIWDDPRTVSTWSTDMAFPTPSERNLEVLTVQHILQGLQLPADLINDAQRFVGRTPVKEVKDDKGD